MGGVQLSRKLLWTPIGLLLFLIGCADLGEKIPTGPVGDIPQLSIEDASNMEGQALEFVISLDRDAEETTTFDWATADGTAAGGADYNSTSGQGSIAIGSRSTLVSITTLNDTLVEPSESFTVSLSNVVGAESARSIATGTISDDDDPGMVSYSTDILPILQAKFCLEPSCHGGVASQGGLMMVDGSFSNVRNAVGNNGAVIVPNDASSSNLYLKTTDMPPFLSRMPLVGNPLSQIQQELIRDWINQGALDN